MTVEGICEIGEIRWMKWGWVVDGRVVVGWVVVVGCKAVESLLDDVSASP